jgi:hypothetical protein
MSALPPQVLTQRHRLCESCLQKCQPYLQGTLRINEPGTVCLHPSGARWLAFSPTLGAGSAFALIAQPVARGVDAVFKTNIRNCRGCTGQGGRKDRWNQAVPDILHPWRRS